MRSHIVRLGLITLLGTFCVYALPASAMTMTQATKLSITGQFYLWKDKVINKVSTATGKTAATIAFPFSGTVNAVAFDDVAHLIGYMTTSDSNVDTLKIRKQGSHYYTTLATADHHYTGKNEVKSSSYRNLRFLTDHTLLASHMYWEGCTDELYRFGTRTRVMTAACSSVLASPNGKRYIRYSAMGMSTGAEFSLATKLSSTGFTPVDWSKVTGDVALLYNTSKDQWVSEGISAAVFLNDNTVMLMSSSGSGQGSYLFRYSIPNKTLTRIATYDFSPIYQMVKAGPYIIGVNNAKLARLSMTTGANEDLVIPIATGSQPTLTILGTAGKAVVVRVQADYSVPQQRYQTDQAIAVDPVKGNYLVLGSGTAVLYAGAAH